MFTYTLTSLTAVFIHMTMNSFYDRYRKMGLGGDEDLPIDDLDCEGMDDASIDALEEELRLPIPDAYRAYLRIAGSSEPWALRGSECNGACVCDLRKAAIGLLRAINIRLPDNAIVFFMHQGYIFDYFLADGITDDPAVYGYQEGWTDVRQVSDRFSDWVGSLITSD